MIQFTQDQEEAAAVIHQLVSRHFDAAVIVLHAEDPNNAANENMKVLTVGGTVRALGLVPVAQAFILSKLHTPPASPPDYHKGF